MPPIHVPSPDSLGRIRLSASLASAEVDVVHELTTHWRVAPGGRVLVVVGRVDVEDAAQSLRLLHRELLRPMEVQLHGAVVIEDVEGRLGLVSARNGRITTRDLWDGAASSEQPRRCAVVDLEVRRAVRQVRPSP